MSFPRIDLNEEDYEFINLLAKKVGKIKPRNVRKDYKERRL